MILEKKYKIALIGYRLSSGGSDRVMARLSVFFEQNNIEVHNIIVVDEVSYPYSGKLVNLGLLKDETNGFFNKFKRLKALRSYLNQNNFDYIIDFRFRTKPIQELIISRFIYNTKVIFTVHSYLIDHYMPNNSWLTNRIYDNSFAVVSLTEKMTKLINEKHQLKNVVTIANPINSEEIDLLKNAPIDLDFQFIIAVGQYENPIKQFDKLIATYSKSDLPKKNIHLVILGDGDRNFLEKSINEFSVSDKVHLLGYQENPFQFISKAKFLVLCSENEGMPNVLIESLACETPVIAFDCNSGPSEIITKDNGILVENQNWEHLKFAMERLISNYDLYLHFKSNAKKSISKFEIDYIGKKWLDLLKIK
ncbi:MAG: glycosyltransferase [Flavobacterium sp.]|uniref:glycosyltransferase n=1 Tax=Flavobacterium sp. TaxID=239 RepID=UPI0022C91555|nr:glycosyltransferase [Flavobacterium sp.]MCZ8331773.1 glycosyltransferase [Flavobacterium sp.]